MGLCRFCGKPAGFLRKEHRECREKHNSGVFIIRSMVADSLSNSVDRDEILKIARESYISNEELKNLILNGLDEAIDKALGDNILTQEEEEKIKIVLLKFGFGVDELSSSKTYEKFIKALILRDILEGKIPKRLDIKGVLPFNLLKNETPIWLFNDVKYYQLKTYRHYVGGSNGFSIRITKGVYYRMGDFRGYPVEETELTKVDEGVMCITDKHIYFGGRIKSFRISYDKIVSFTPYSDGIGIQRDSTNARPEYFITNDGWFTYNLVVNLANRG
ncbi:MAG: hypothetical protein N2380_05085 [bacterium]|nr:hypothetical protein [bacterium]